MSWAIHSTTTHIHRRARAFLTHLFSKVLPYTREERLAREIPMSCIERREKSVQGTLITYALSFSDERVRAVIHTLKYHAFEPSISYCAAAVHELLHTELAAYPDAYIVPMPLHPTREHERGYNQVRLVIDRIGTIDENIRTHIDTHVLHRVKHTKTQTACTRKERLENMQDAFIASPDAHGKTFILIDDVATTGATLLDARRALLLAGAARVRCMACAAA